MSFIWVILNKISFFGDSPKTLTFSQTLKGYNSDTVCPFKLKFHVEDSFDELYLSHPLKPFKTQKLHIPKKYLIYVNYAY